MTALNEKKVLAVDDNDTNIFVVDALLEEQGMEVLTANDGQEALDVLEAHPDVDIVLMDIMMPVMNGYEAMRHIRSNARFGQVPIIALTARAMVGDSEKCLEAGATSYVSKPIDAEVLVGEITSLLS